MLDFFSTRWLDLRLGVLGACITASCAALLVLHRASLSSAYAGLAITSATAVLGLLSSLLFVFAIVEASINSIDRVRQYSTMPVESAAVIDGSVPAAWPQQGGVLFQDVSLSYRDGSILALRHVSFTVTPSSRVGIVGRTGSGKSSLFMALLRVVECSRGAIFIDDIDVSTIGILRS